MPEKEITVAPVLETRIKRGTERGQCRFAGLMKVNGVVCKSVTGREIHSPAKPEHICLAIGKRAKETYIHMHRRHIGITRMQHQRYAHGLIAPASQPRAMRRSRRWQGITRHMREIHPATFEQRAILNHTGDTAPPLGPFPAIRAKAAAVEVLQRSHDILLQGQQIVFYRDRIHMPSVDMKTPMHRHGRLS